MTSYEHIKNLLNKDKWWKSFIEAGYGEGLGYLKKPFNEDYDKIKKVILFCLDYYDPNSPIIVTSKESVKMKEEICIKYEIDSNFSEKLIRIKDNGIYDFITWNFNMVKDKEWEAVKSLEEWLSELLEICRRRIDREGVALDEKGDPIEISMGDDKFLKAVLSKKTAAESIPELMTTIKEMRNDLELRFGYADKNIRADIKGEGSDGSTESIVKKASKNKKNNITHDETDDN